MDGVQDFNSSDLDFSSDDDLQPARHKIGQASIDKIIADADQDRISSKRTLKKLQFGGAAPMTHYTQSLWVARFNAFRERSLHQSPDTPFSGADMIRFMDSIIGKVSRPPPQKPPFHPTCRPALAEGGAPVCVCVCVSVVSAAVC